MCEKESGEDREGQTEHDNRGATTDHLSRNRSAFFPAALSLSRTPKDRVAHAGGYKELEFPLQAIQQGSDRRAKPLLLGADQNA
jgi:hypothetical protein